MKNALSRTNPEELFPIVEKIGGRLVIRGSVTRKHAHDHGIRHLAVHIVPISLNASGEDIILYLNRRASTKRTCPNRIDFAGGHIGFDADEADPGQWTSEGWIARASLAAAVREAQEEVVCDPPLCFTERHLDRFGEVGEFEDRDPIAGGGMDDEVSSAYVLALPRGSRVQAWDADRTGKHRLEVIEYAWPDLLAQFHDRPGDFASGLARVLRVIVKDKSRAEAFYDTLTRSAIRIEGE